MLPSGLPGPVPILAGPGPLERLDMTDEILEAVRFRLEQDHPVMAAMATKLERISQNVIRITFDGPALPQKLTLETSAAVAAPFLEHCERAVAAAMKKAGLGV